MSLGGILHACAALRRGQTPRAAVGGSLHHILEPLPPVDLKAVAIDLECRVRRERGNLADVLPYYNPRGAKDARMGLEYVLAGRPRQWPIGQQVDIGRDFQGIAARGLDLSCRGSSGTQLRNQFHVVVVVVVVEVIVAPRILSHSKLHRFCHYDNDSDVLDSLLFLPPKRPISASSRFPPADQ